MKQLGTVVLLYGFSGLAFLLLGELLADKTIDIAVHDTYFVVAYDRFFAVPGLHLLLFGLITLFFQMNRKPLPEKLNVIVYGLSLLSWTGLLLLLTGVISSPPSKYSDYSVTDVWSAYNQETPLQLWLVSAIGLLCGSMLVFAGMVFSRLFKQ